MIAIGKIKEECSEGTGEAKAVSSEHFSFNKQWSVRADLNRRPLPCQSSAVLLDNSSINNQV